MARRTSLQGAGYYSMGLHGDRELMQALGALPFSVERKLLAESLMYAASPILKAARAKAPKETGLLRRSIKARRASRTRKHTRLVMIGPTHMKTAFRRTKKGKLRRVGKKGMEAIEAKWRRHEVPSAGQNLEYRDPGNYAHLVEFGRSEVVPKKKRVLIDSKTGQVFGRRTRAVRARPFLRPAFDAHASTAEARITKRLWQGIEREAKLLDRTR